MPREADVKRMAFIACGGGGVIDALCSVQASGAWPYTVVGVVTDRVCGAEQVAARHNLQWRRIDHTDQEQFSAEAAEIISSWRADCVVLLYLRRVGPAIWRDLNLSVWNLHPSLLPEYPGIGALERNFRDARAAARDGRTLRMGVTMHIATGDLDEGPIINQRYFTIDDAPTLEMAQHICYLYKVALALEGVCKLVDGTLPTWRDPPHAQPWHERYVLWKPYEPIMDVHRRLAQPWAAEWLRRKLHEGAARTVGRLLKA